MSDIADEWASFHLTMMHFIHDWPVNEDCIKPTGVTKNALIAQVEPKLC